MCKLRYAFLFLIMYSLYFPLGVCLSLIWFADFCSSHVPGGFERRAGGTCLLMQGGTYSIQASGPEAVDLRRSAADDGTVGDPGRHRTARHLDDAAVTAARSAAEATTGPAVVVERTVV